MFELISAFSFLQNIITASFKKKKPHYILPKNNE